MAKLVFLVLAALCCVSLTLAASKDDTSHSDVAAELHKDVYKHVMKHPWFEKMLNEMFNKASPSRKRRNIVSSVALKTAMCITKEVAKNAAKGAWNKITGKKEDESIQKKVLNQIPGGKLALLTSTCASQAVADTAKDVAKAELDDLKNKVDTTIDTAKKALDDPLAAADEVTKQAKSAISQQMDLTKNFVTNPIGTVQDTVSSVNDRVVDTKKKVMAPVNAIKTLSKLLI